MAMVRVAVVYFSKSKSSRVNATATALAKALEARGAQVDLVNGSQTRDAKLTGHHFLAIGCDVLAAFGGKLPPELKVFLANSGLIAGKRALAWVTSAPLGANKTLLQLMRAMEAEGLLLQTSEIFTKADEASRVASQLKIDGLTVS